MLTIEEKLDLIKKYSQENNITAYEFGQKAGISEMSAYNILSNKNLNPRNKTLNLMIEYIEKRITGTKLNQLNEEESIYNKEQSIEERISNNVLEKIKPFLIEETNLINKKLDKLTGLLSQIILDIDDIEEKINKKEKKTTDG